MKKIIKPKKPKEPKFFLEKPQKEIGGFNIIDHEEIVTVQDLLDQMPEGIDYKTILDGKGGASGIMLQYATMLKDGKSIYDIDALNPGFVLNHQRKIQDYVTLQRTKRMAENVVRFKPEDFNMPLLPIEEMFKLNKSILLIGESQLGKTEFCKVHFKSPMVVRNIDDLKWFNESIHDGLIYDDVSFLHCPFQQVLNVLDLGTDRTIHCRNVNPIIPRNIRLLFTSNRENPFYDPLKTDPAHQQAIENRIAREYVYGSLIKEIST